MSSIRPESGLLSPGGRRCGAQACGCRRAAPADARSCPSSSTLAPAARKRVERNIDAIEIAIILPAILQVIDDLQRRAKRIVGRPGRAALAMHVEHEAPDRHGRIAAIVDQIVPVAVAQLGHIHAGTRSADPARGAATGARAASCARKATPAGIVVAAAEQAASSRSSSASFSCGASIGVVGDVVGDAHELVERQDRRRDGAGESAARRRESSRPGGPCPIAVRQE